MSSYIITAISAVAEAGSCNRICSYTRRRIRFLTTADLCTFLLTTTAARYLERIGFATYFRLTPCTRTIRPFLWRNANAFRPRNRCAAVIIQVISITCGPRGWHSAALYLCSQARAAFVAAPVQYGLSCFICHSFQKAMLSGAVTFLWLIGSLWHSRLTLSDCYSLTIKYTRRGRGQPHPACLHILLWSNFGTYYSKFSTFLQVLSTD